MYTVPTSKNQVNCFISGILSAEEYLKVDVNAYPTDTHSGVKLNVYTMGLRCYVLYFHHVFDFAATANDDHIAFSCLPGVLNQGLDQVKIQLNLTLPLRVI